MRGPKVLVCDCGALRLGRSSSSRSRGGAGGYGWVDGEARVLIPDIAIGCEEGRACNEIFGWCEAKSR